MFHRSILLLAVCMMAGCSENMSQLGGKPSDAVSMGDNHFFKVASNANQTEIETSQLAMNQAQSPRVRELAQQMITDHTKAQNQLQTLASSKGAALPQQLDSIHQAMVNNLQNKSGSDFDRAYVQTQITAHQDTIANVQNEVNNGTDPDVKSLADQLLPTLRMHLQMAQDVQKGL
jgi:putative membrane protein